ncbi:hypothetical protein CP533_2764 [Ophiocordyceps camponoti-saundersi (nom. inval.)]|nr:hypothetical protein CP533_2764 [Ophiocordyceps camponoti-saundersi (nom. inval.)]
MLVEKFAGAEFCTSFVNLMEKVMRHRPVCRSVDAIEVEYTTADGYKPNKDEISFDFYDRWAYNRPQLASSPQWVAGGAMPGLDVRFSIDMLASFGKKSVCLTEVNLLAIRSHASFSAGRGRHATPWKLVDTRKMRGHRKTYRGQEVEIRQQRVVASGPGERVPDASEISAARTNSITEKPTCEMKRKLDQDDVPSSDAPEKKPEKKPEKETEGKKKKASRSAAKEKNAIKETRPAATKIAKDADKDDQKSFADFGLDPRLLQAVSEQKLVKPTLVQRKAIPMALDGHDVLCRAKTGSGKTAAYVLPVLAGILKRKMAEPQAAALSGLILVPTRELADQVFKVVERFAAYCAKDVQVIKLTDKLSDAVQRSLLSTTPDLVISTPARAWHHVKSDLDLSKLSYLVLDEADLLLSYGYDKDLESLSWSLPKGIQTIMMSATLTAEIDSLKSIFYKSGVPTLLDLEEPDADGAGVTQLVTRCSEDDKFLLAYVIFKLRLVKGKCIIFVADVDRCYRLKLFLEQFGIRSCILNPELPVNSRLHVVDEFNRNVYDIIIASDDKEVLGDEDKAEAGTEKEENEDEDEDEAQRQEEKQRLSKKRKVSSRGDKEFGVSRGIDFKNVAAVVNFDLPTTASSYTHRIGRTARAGKAGMALSFVVPSELYRKHIPTTVATAEKDEAVLARIVKQQAKKGKEVKPYTFKAEEIDAFRYRMNDGLRAVTKVAVREARTRELRQELLKSEKLKRYFEENPTEMKHVRHDGELRTARQQAHLKHVPDYLLPKEGRKALTEAQIGPVRFRDHRRRSRRGSAKKRKSGDPLKTFRRGSSKRS